MRPTSDNRMNWIRNFGAPLGRADSYVVEFEIGSECQIPGLLVYAKGGIVFGPMATSESKDGLWLYNLILRLRSGPTDRNPNANPRGYYFKDGIIGELLALFSLFLRCRFFLISARLRPTDPRRGITVKMQFPFLRVRTESAIHPPLFQTGEKNLAIGLRQFLDSVKALDEGLHQKFILACYHYERALKEVGVDDEMVFIRLVSAIETLSQDFVLDAADDALEQDQVRSLIGGSQLSEANKNDLNSIFEARKSRKKFIRFVERQCTGLFKGGNFKAPHCKIKRSDLGKVLDAIYRARSKYLHAGEPMFLSRPLKASRNWDLDPTEEMIVGNRLFPSSQKLPYAYFFDGLVRRCLLNYLKQHSSYTKKEQSLSIRDFRYSLAGQKRPPIPRGA